MLIDPPTFWLETDRSIVGGAPGTTAYCVGFTVIVVVSVQLVAAYIRKSITYANQRRQLRRPMLVSFEGVLYVDRMCMCMGIAWFLWTFNN